MTENLGWALDRAVAVAADRLAVVDGDRRLTYAELGRRVAAMGTGLHGLGVKRGDVVGVLSLNSLTHLECWLGIPRHGAILNDLNYRLSPAELSFVVDDCDTAVLIVDDAHLPVGRAILESSRSLRHLICMGSGAAPGDTIAYEDLVAGDVEPSPVVDGGDLAGIFYTGGTTGRPKGVMLTHDNLVANAKHTIIALGHVSSDRYLHAAPMFHLADGSQTYALTWVGGTHVIVPAFDAATVLETIEREGVTRTVLVPTMINMVVHHPTAHAYDLSSLRQILYGASPMPEKLQRTAMELIPSCDWVQGYGMTETSPMVTAMSAEDHRRGMMGDEPYASRLRSAGTPIVGVQAEIRRPDGALADVGEIGEIWIRGPNIMAGYWNRPEETAAALPGDGWFRSGDMAFSDKDAYLYIVDRAKDMIISGGENVYSTEVENVIYEHPAVIEAAVIGVPDEKWGERIHAVVVISAGATVDQDELIDHCRQRIARFKAPRSVEFRLDPLPKSGSGKILKRDLREPYWESEHRRVH